MKTQGIEELVAWQKAMDLAVSAHQYVGKAKDQEFKSTFYATALSISSEIARGFQQRHKDFREHLAKARSASNVLRSMTHIGEKLNFLDEAAANDIRQQCEDVAKIVSGLIKALQPKPQVNAEAV